MSRDDLYFCLNQRLYGAKCKEDIEDEKKQREEYEKRKKQYNDEKEQYAKIQKEYDDDMNTHMSEHRDFIKNKFNDVINICKKIGTLHAEMIYEHCGNKLDEDNRILWDIREIDRNIIRRLYDMKMIVRMINVDDNKT